MSHDKPSRQSVRNEDQDFISDSRSSILFSTPRFVNVGLYSIIGFFICAFIWAVFAHVDEVTVATATVVPTGNTQLIQNLEGGLVKALHVHEGDEVKAGQLLAELDPTTAKAQYHENLARYNSLKLSNLRLLAQANNHQQLHISDAHLAPYAALIEKQQQLLDTNLSAYHKVLSNLTDNYNLALKELHIAEPMVAKGLMSEFELIKQKRVVMELKGKIEEVKANHKKEALKEYDKNEAALASLTERLFALKDRMQRTQIFSPMDGIINNIVVSTIGGVLQPGITLMEVIPVEDTLVIEAKIKPADIAFIQIGQDATVKLDAYDYSIYGGLTALVTHISPSTITDEQGEVFYEIKLKTFKTTLSRHDVNIQAKPGMTAKVDILTGRKTVYDYIMKPIFKAKQTAFREK